MHAEEPCGRLASYWVCTVWALVVRGSDNTQSVVYMYSQPGKYIHQVN